MLCGLLGLGVALEVGDFVVEDEGHVGVGGVEDEGAGGLLPVGAAEVAHVAAEVVGGLVEVDGFAMLLSARFQTKGVLAKVRWYSVPVAEGVIMGLW